jgi:hypothetical protein
MLGFMSVGVVDAPNYSHPNKKALRIQYLKREALRMD